MTHRHQIAGIKAGRERVALMQIRIEFLKRIAGGGGAVAGPSPTPHHGAAAGPAGGSRTTRPASTLWKKLKAEILKR